MLVALAGAAVVYAFRGSSTVGPGAPASIAVLPFVDMSPSGDMEYFGDGMAEEILNVLGRLPALKVAGRTSSFSFKNKGADLKSIGEALGVATVLEGSVRQSAGQIRITAQLIRTDDQSHLWSETYNRRFDEDVFAVQDEIARAVVAALRVELGGEEAPSIEAHRGTRNLEAYNAYLLGRFQWSRRTREGVTGSVASFQEAIRIDPKFARAYTGLADAYIVMGNFGFAPTREAYPRAREAVDRALALEPELAEAHVSLGAILGWYEWDFEGADRAFRRAISLDPRNAFAHYWYAILLEYINRPDEARAMHDVALRLDPLALQIRNGLGNSYQWRGDYEAAIREYRSILRIDPDFQNARWWLGLAYLESGRAVEGLAVLDSVPGGFVNGKPVRGWALAQLGHLDEARAALASISPDTAHANLTFFVRGYTLLGQPDDAFRELRAAFRRRDYSLLQIVHTPPSDPLRADPRFNELLADMGLLRYWK